MDEYSSKRARGGVTVPRKGSGLVLRDASDSRDGNAQFCDRLGCSGRLNYMKGAQIGSSEKSKLLRPSFRSSSGKEVIGSSSKTSSTASSVRKSFQGSRRKLSSKTETDSSESSSVRDESDVTELISPSRRTCSEFQSESRDDESSKVASMEVGSTGIASNTSTRKVYRQKSGLANQDNEFGSIGSSASESTGRGPREGYNAGRYGLRNLRCNSVSDVLSNGCSYSESNNGRRGDMLKKRITEGESSSSIRGKKMSEPSSHEGRIPHSMGGISISDSRPGKNSPCARESGVSSVRTHRSVGGSSRLGRFNQLQGNNSSSADSPMLTPHLPQPEIQRFSADTSSSGSSSNGRPTNSDTLSIIIPVTSADLGITRLVNRDGLRRYNMDGIAEVLLALERIEQDEELTYEQLLSLETNLFLGGLNFYDQHRDMRLDIDNMSYEELLALEEEMGTVNTALSEEALSKCLRIGIYQPSYSKDGDVIGSGDGDDIKCSICQEEYCIGDEIGRLGCEHGYHALCVNQWLRLKNWCPICKASVEA